MMSTNHLGAIVVVALVTSACGSPGSVPPSADEPSNPVSASPSPTADACGDWAAEASDDVVLLHFPCGSLGEMAAVERTVTANGDERVTEVLQLHLAGPNAEEREAGYSTMLAPGDIDIVEVSPPRLVLDFPSEVNNASTSAGSGALIASLRQTLIGLNGIEEIELRLRNDCAAFFEWIQVGPTCHVLTADGLASAQAPSPAAAAIQVATCEHSSGAYRVALPEGWWTNPEFEDGMGLTAACRFFGPSEFDVSSADRDIPIPDGTAIWIDYLDHGCVGYINEILWSRETTVAGYPAVVSELAFGKEEVGPPFTYEYVVTLTPGTDCETGGRYIYAVTSRDDAGDFEDNRAVLDQMMETIEIQLPGGMDPVAVCAEQARGSGPDVEVVGSYATTVSKVRGLTPEAEPARWHELTDETPAVVCYLDGSVPKAPPGGEPYDRAVLGVAGGHAELIIAGYRDQLPVEAP